NSRILSNFITEQLFKRFTLLSFQLQITRYFTCIELGEYKMKNILVPLFCFLVLLAFQVEGAPIVAKRKPKRLVVGGLKPEAKCEMKPEYYCKTITLPGGSSHKFCRQVGEKQVCS
uniref:Uncharacterized protein n=1 Tax=Clytia hemisphaerica TaxID=252671 RepID=A0A7M6DQW9_9CNID